MNLDGIKSYKERIYSDIFRKKYHEARFLYLRNSIIKYNINTSYVLEIGCGDAESINYIPNQPQLYVGIDANWEGLLDQAIKKYKYYKNFFFINSHHPVYFEHAKAKITFDLAIALETFEHLDSSLLSDYLKFLKSSVDGYIITTFPVELGPIFLIKFLIKSFIYKDDFETKFYSLKEVLYATFFFHNKVEKLITSHKGFDYREFMKVMQRNFIVKEIKGIPYNIRPLFLNPTIGIVAQNKL